MRLLWSRAPGLPSLWRFPSARAGGNRIETPLHTRNTSRPAGLAVWIATFFGVGYCPVAPGTAGAAAGLVLYAALSGLSPMLYLLTCVALVFLGIWAAEEFSRQSGIHDDGRIVIDEVAGQLLSLLPLVFLNRRGSIPLVVTGFVLFRVLDVWKPGPVRWLERNLSGGAGVVMDDVLAGVFAAAALGAIAWKWQA
jgi:phosphatidylglycerophosphatase A